MRNESLPLDLFLERADKTPMRVAGTAVFLNARTDVVPASLLHNLKHNRVLHERVILAHVTVDDTPFVRKDKRIEVTKLGKGFYSVNVHHGFFETPDVPLALTNARAFGLAVDVDHTTFFVGRETLVPVAASGARPLADLALHPACRQRFVACPLLLPAAQSRGRTGRADHDLKNDGILHVMCR